MWLIALLAVLVLIGILVLGIGSMLPKEHHVTRRAHINRSPTEIWEVLTDFAGQPEWRMDVRSVKRLSDQNGRQAWQETDKRGRPWIIETVESVAPRRLVRRIANVNSVFGGTWTYEIGEYGEVTAMTITEDGEVYNPYFRFISKFIIGQTGTIDSYLKSLGKKLGIEVEITSV